LAFGCMIIIYIATCVRTFCRNSLSYPV